MAKVVGALAFGGAAVALYMFWQKQERAKAEFAAEQDAAFYNAQLQLQQQQQQAPRQDVNPWAPVISWGLGEIMNGSKSNGGGGFLSGLFGGNKAKSGATASKGGASAGGNNGAILDLIGSVEAPHGYDQYYGGIKSKDGPPKPLTSMTVNEVLAWQDSIDPHYPSEAAGRYQVMEDTLRPLVQSGQINGNAKFNSKTQDQIGVILMQRRGLDDYRAGRISPEKFGNNLAKEWAGLPVITGSKAGKSYYGGDGLNSSHISTSKVLNVLKGKGLA